MGPLSTQGRVPWVADSGQSAGAVQIVCYTVGSSSPSPTDPTAWYFQVSVINDAGADHRPVPAGPSL